MAKATSNYTINTGLKLAGKVAIVTGGASGIGKATTHLFSDQGARMVVIADIQDQLGKQVATSIGAEKCSYVHCDVADEEQVSQTPCGIHRQYLWTTRHYVQQRRNYESL